jgi:dihydroorotate dehydrogenase
VGGTLESVPDWFYRTVAQPILFRLPDSAARAVALGCVGALGRSPPGRWLIDLLGHLRADGALAGEKAGVRWAAPVGLGVWVDPEARATRALDLFGAGFVEIGPVSRVPRAGSTARRAAGGEPRLERPADRRHFGVEPMKARLRRMGRTVVPRWIRVAPSPGVAPATAGAQIVALAGELAEWADVFVVERAPAGLGGMGERPWLAVVTGEEELDAVPSSAAGVLAECELDPVVLARWRARLGSERVLVATGMGEPADLVALLAAGADAVQGDAALVFAGPGAIKRAHELLAAERAGAATPAKDGARGPRAAASPAPRQAWFWGGVLGGALAAGGLVTLVLALGPVLLPYDEHYLGLTAAELARLQPLVHDFMAHDRATLAGTMLGLGALYLALALGGMRRGGHWAQVALTSSALVGFASFFSFLGFGYFDPLHAFVSVVLLQFTLLAMVTRLPPPKAELRSVWIDAREDAAWRRGQWGQLLFVLHAVGLLGAGGVISAIGMTRVFVRTDLEFLCATPAELAAFNDRLVAVVAHDRAALGGMLLAAGVAQGLATLWGPRRGRSWLWWGLLGLGLPAYTAAIGIHLEVGYTDPLHLAPAVAGAALWAAGLVLTHGWLKRH